MSDLGGLPDELLLAVAKCLQGDANTFQPAYNDLRHLALSCRKLRPIAQEVLHLDVAVMNTRWLRGPSSSACLARTLLQRPDLAIKIQKLHIEVPSYEQCCTYGLRELLHSCMDFLRITKSSNGISLHNENWALMLENASEAALARLILCTTSTLRTITLTYWNEGLFPRLDTEQPENGEHVSFDEFIGSLSSHGIGGLSSLTRLVTKGFSPIQLLGLPRLQAARIGRLDDDWYGQDLAKLRSYTAPGGVVSTTLTRLVIQPDLRAFDYGQVTPMHGMHEYLIKIISGLTNLTLLSILIFGILDDGIGIDGPAQGSYAHITSKLESRSITHLTLGFNGMAHQYADDPMTAEYVLEYIHDMGPMTSFPGLPNLCNLAAPQEAFFSADGDFETCNLPTSIESIGVIGSTYEMKRYIKHVLNHQEQWPNLKLVKLVEGTYDHLYKHPDGSNDKAAGESDGEEWRKLFEVNDSIYGQAKSCGVRVEKVQNRTA